MLAIPHRLQLGTERAARQAAEGDLASARAEAGAQRRRAADLAAAFQEQV